MEKYIPHISLFLLAALFGFWVWYRQTRIKVTVRSEDKSTVVRFLGIAKFEWWLFNLLKAMQQVEHLELADNRPDRITLKRQHRDPDAAVDPFYTIATIMIEARYRRMNSVWRLISRYRTITVHKPKFVGFEP